MHAVDMYDIIKTYVLPNAYERETYRIYRKQHTAHIAQMLCFTRITSQSPGLHVALTSIAITNETRKACFISFKLIPEFLFVIMRVSGVLLVESLSV